MAFTSRSTTTVTPARRLFLNIGHFCDHLFLPIFPVVVLALEAEWGRPFETLIWPLTVGMIGFAGGTIPAGWLGDRWSRDGMLTIFFLGIGASSVLTGFMDGPIGLAVGLGLIGIFAAIYHPVGLAMVVSGTDRVGKVLGVNGVWGNMGVAAAALIAGLLTERLGWRAAFIVPGGFSILLGLAYLIYLRRAGTLALVRPSTPVAGIVGTDRRQQVRTILLTLALAACGGLIFGSMTVVLPKALSEGVPWLTGGTGEVGLWAAAIFALASFAQLVAGPLADRVPARVLIFTVGVGQAVCLLLLAGGASSLALPLAALGVMLFAFGQIPINDTLIARNTDPHWRARVYAFKHVLTFGVATVQVPLIAWLRGQSGDFHWLFALLTGLAVAIALVALWLPGRKSVLAAPA